MNVSFSQQEEMAIKQLAQILDISEESVVIQSLRMYQLWKMNKIQLTWPKVVLGKLYEADVPIAETPSETDQQVVIQH